ncbi:hypothetical protein T11_4380 [Trichinella zimbabwensis]|uniref:Uncharacterized protein n=1 Tax=Trichinella zimbabwensis TaxID=268475 RepID=A0A0V1GY37_9BILA|nr:hypothetical protein T11_4380 [Trichinella zimbabwensis]
MKEEEEEEEDEESSKLSSNQLRNLTWRLLESTTDNDARESSRPVKWQWLANANANHYEQLTEEWSDMPSAGEFINLSKEVTDSIRYRFNIHKQDN